MELATAANTGEAREELCAAGLASTTTETTQPKEHHATRCGLHWLTDILILKVPDNTTKQPHQASCSGRQTDRQASNAGR
jgi:hypothetical protein